MLSTKPPLSFTARIIRGAGRGKRLGVPTINLDLGPIPDELPEGIYAVRVRFGEEEQFLEAVMHFGPRPVFQDSRSCEVHLLTGKSQIPNPKSQTLTVEVVKRLRDVRNFEDAGALKEQMAKDIAEAIFLLHSGRDAQ